MITVDRETWDRWNETGEWALFRAGDRILNPTASGVRQRAADIKPTPPAEFVEWAKPCETCHGLTIVPTPRPVVNGPIIPEFGTCHNCLGGKRRIDVAVPCDCGCHDADDGFAEWDCRCDDGLVTVGHVVVTWGPLVVVRWHEKIGSEPAIWLDTSMDGTWVLSIWDGTTSTDIMSETCGGVGFPPDIDPATLVGQYALGGKVVTP